MSVSRIWVAAIAALAALMSTSTPVAAQSDVDADTREVWARHGPMLEAEGITFPMLKSLSLWIELQFLLGRCGRHLPPGNVAYWRTWWDDTGLKENPAFLRLWSEGDKLYNSGLRDAETDPPTPLGCRRTAASWFTDMKDATAEAEADIASRSGR